MYQSASLLADPAYMHAHEQQSKFSMHYRMAFPPTRLDKASAVATSCAGLTGGCRQFHVTSGTVAAYNTLLPISTRPQPSANTQLYGTAPFKGLGDGMLQNPDISTSLRPESSHACSGPLAEIAYDRFQCMSAPMVVESGARGGVNTRLGVQYLSPNC